MLRVHEPLRACEHGIIPRQIAGYVGEGRLYLRYELIDGGQRAKADGTLKYAISAPADTEQAHAGHRGSEPNVAHVGEMIPVHPRGLMCFKLLRCFL